MHAKTVGGQAQRVAVVVGEGFAAGDGQGLFDDPLRIVMHRAAKPPRRQPAVRQVGAIGEGLEQQRHVGLVGQFQLAAVVGQGQHHQRQALAIGGAGVEHGAQQLIVADQVVVQRAMRLDIGHLGTEGTAESVQRTDLVQHHGMHLFGRAGQRAPAEAAQVGIGRVRADAHAMAYRQLHRAPHGERVASVEAASQVGLVNQRHAVDIVAHAPGAKAFAHVAVEQDTPAGVVHCAFLSRPGLQKNERSAGELASGSILRH